MHNVMRIIGTQEVENAVKVAESLWDITNQFLLIWIAQNNMSVMEMKAVVQQKQPNFTMSHMRGV
jgi:hypothetical protein